MWIIGDGYMYNELEKLDIKDVTFYGRLEDNLKYELLSRAHIVLVPSVREGWGLAVTESNAMGAPAVAYNVLGQRDSIIDGETGILAKQNSPEGISPIAVSLLKDRELLNKLSTNALFFSKQFNWDNTACAFDLLIKDISCSQQSD